MTVHRGGSFLVWLGTPPLVSLPILILLVSSGVRGEGTPLGLPLWTGIFMGYAALTGGYIGLAWKEDPLGLAAAELLAQGLLVTTLSLALGSFNALWGLAALAALVLAPQALMPLWGASWSAALAVWVLARCLPPTTDGTRRV